MTKLLPVFQKIWKWAKSPLKHVFVTGIAATVLTFGGSWLLDEWREFQACQTVLVSTRADADSMAIGEEERRAVWRGSLRDRFLKFAHTDERSRPWLMPEAQGALSLVVYQASLPNLSLVSEDARTAIVRFYSATFQLDAAIRTTYGPSAIFAGGENKEWLDDQLDQREKSWDSASAAMKDALAKSECHWP